MIRALLSSLLWLTSEVLDGTAWLLHAAAERLAMTADALGER